jgi:hypothetical protein
MRARFIAALVLLLGGLVHADLPVDKDMAAYLLVYFKDADHSIHFALSSDGYRFTDVNGGRPVIDGREIAEQKGIRDPHLARGPDGSFYLAMTDLHIFAQKEGLRSTEWERDGKAYGWGNNRGLVFMKTGDLLSWKRANVRVDQAFPALAGIGCAWAPETVYDAEQKKLMVHFTMRFGNGLNRIYYSYVDAGFTRLETEPKPLFEYPKNVNFIDGDIVREDGRFHLFYVPHDGMAGVKQAVSESLTAGYSYDPAYCDPEPKACEAPNVWKRIGEAKWVLMYDVYGVKPHNFGFAETTDFKTFTPLGRFNAGPMKAVNFSSPKHGSVIHLTKPEADRLAAHWKLELY